MIISALISWNYKMYYTYIIECEDSTLYTGVAKDVLHRMDVHSKKIRQSAKYTRSHTYKALLAVWESDSRSSAQKLEYRIKKLTRAQKLSLISDNSLFEKYFSDINDIEYIPINIQ